MSGLALNATSEAQPRRRQRSQVDWPLVAGAVCFGALLLLAVYGPLVAPHDVYYARALLNGAAPPFPPSPEYPFGSDLVGHDRFSWFLVGARGTVTIALAAAFIRVCIGASLGLIAGFRADFIAEVLRRLALALSSVPATIAALLALIALGVTAEYFVLALGLIGWAEPFHQARRHSRAESSRPFVESARCLGVSRARLLLRHVLPNVAPGLVTTAAFQVSAVLLLMGELALLNFFVGGSIIVDFDSRGRAIVAPAQPNWASMLGTTRPIINLYDDLAAVLLPAAALLGAVSATNLFGDALASRAQRLDVYRLFARRHLLALVPVAIAIVLSVVAWPSRLATELDYARGFDGAAAVALARELAAPTYGGRVSGSAGAERAAVLLAERMGGDIVRGTDVTTGVANAELVIDDRRAAGSAFSVLSIDNAEASGPLLYADPHALFARGPTTQLAGTIVAMDAPSAAALGIYVQRATALAMRALIVLDAGETNFRREPGLYAIPVVRMTPTALASHLRRSLPSLPALAPRVAALADVATLRIRIEQVAAPVASVVARQPAASSDRPLVLVAARYDNASDVSANWSTATSAAVLAGVVDYLRAEPLALEVIAVATSTDHQSYAGLRLALAQLTSAERGRLRALVMIGPLLSGPSLVETETDLSMPSGTGRLAARLKDATGIALDARAAGDLLRAVQQARVSAPPITFSARGYDREPSSDALARNARLILAALYYIPRHPDEMR